MSDSNETSTSGAFDPPTQVVDPPTEIKGDEQHQEEGHEHADDEEHEHEHEEAEGEGEGEGDEPVESEEAEHEEDDDSGKKKKSGKKLKKDKEGKKKGKKKKKSKRPGGGYLDVEVEVSSDEEISDDEDMDEDEDGILEDLIADEDEDVPQERRRRRKRKAKPIRLDDEDLELIKENTGQYVARDVDEDVIPDTEERAYRRLKKQRGDDDVFIPVVPLDEIHAQSQSASSDLASAAASASSARARHPHALSHEGKDYGPDPDADDEDYAEGDEGEEVEEGLYGGLGMGMGMGEMSGLDGGRDRAKERLMDLFGDMSQFFQDQKVVAPSVDESVPVDQEEQKKRAQGLLKKLDPSLQRTQFLTQTDDLIRSLDVPERLQTRYHKRVEREGEARELALVEEAQWIFRNAFMNPTGAVRKLSSDIIPMITQLLRYLRLDNLEMPFIQHYRKEHYTTPGNSDLTLTPEELQAINEWDERWDTLDGRKQKLIKMGGDFGLDASKQVELEHLIRDASTEMELDDVQDYLTARAPSSASSSSSLDLSQSQSQSQSQGEDGFRAPRRPRSSLVEDHDEFSQSTSAMLESVHLDDDESSSSASQQQRRQKRGLLRPAIFGDEESLVSRFALKPDELAQNLQRGFKQHAPSDPDVSPETMARGYLEGMDEAARKKNFKLRSEEDVLVWMRHQAAQRLCEEPLLRREVRERFMSHCTIDTAPTPKGIREMDWMHEYFSVKRIENKPVAKFAGEQFVLMARAEDEGFIKIKFELKGDQEELVNYLFKQYQSSNVSENAQRWNQQRRQILQEACSRQLWRLGEQHIRQHLLQRSRDFITRQAQERLREMASVAPYTPEQMLKDEKRPMRIISIYLGEQDEPTYACVLSKWGDVLDSLTLHFLKSRASANPEAPPGERASYAKKREDARRFQELLSHHQPLAIFIDASSTQAQRFRRDLEESVLNDFRHIRVEYSDPQIGRIFMNSERSQFEFKDYPKGLCHAISSGRYLLDPLAEMCAMWYFDSESHSNELLALNLARLQNAVPLEMMLKGLQQVLLEMVAAVGLDINKILQRPFLASEVQFVCGLGPRKAKALLDALRLRGHLGNRHDLLAAPPVDAELGGGPTIPLMGPAVFQNCAGFLQVRRNVAMEEKPAGRLQLLDSTRIHPESYKLAKQVVYDALEVDEDEEDDDSKDLSRDQLEDYRHERFTKHLQDLMERSANQLDELDLDAFAQMEEQSGRGKKLYTLYMIKAELAAPFDWHKVLKDWKPLTPERLFTLLTGENDETLREGMPMAVRIGRIRDDGAFCQLDSAELTGFVRWDRIAHDYPQDIAQNPSGRLHWLKTVLQEGSTVQARVLRINKERCRVELSCHPDDVKSSRLERNWIEKNISDKDPYFRGHYEHEDERRLLNAGNEQKDAKRYLPRNIIHPLFKNVGRDEALALLADRAPGEMVVRPATGSLDALTVTWKVHDDVYFDFRIQEKEKPNPYELGAQLVIDGQTYEDLDQIQATFVEPMSRSATKLIDSPKFRFGPEAELDQMLRTDKSNEPSRIAYCFSVSARHPGMFAFSYLSSRTIHREYVVATPRGYVLPASRQQASAQPAPAKKQVYRSYEELVNALKQKIMRRDKEQRRMAPPPVPQMYHPGQGYSQPPHSAGAYSSRHGGGYYGSAMSRY